MDTNTIRALRSAFGFDTFGAVVVIQQAEAGDKGAQEEIQEALRIQRKGR